MDGLKVKRKRRLNTPSISDFFKPKVNSTHGNSSVERNFIFKQGNEHQNMCSDLTGTSIIQTTVAQCDIFKQRNEHYNACTDFEW